jgi:hypothetical protein
MIKNDVYTSLNLFKHSGNNCICTSHFNIKILRLRTENVCVPYGFHNKQISFP